MSVRSEGTGVQVDQAEAGCVGGIGARVSSEP